MVFASLFIKSTIEVEYSTTHTILQHPTIVLLFHVIHVSHFFTF